MQFGSNRGDFYLSEMTDYIRLVTNRLKMPYGDFKPVGRFEFSVNVHQYNAMQFVEKISTHKLKAIKPLEYRNKKYGVISGLKAIRPKLYSHYMKELINTKEKPGFRDDFLRMEIVTSASYLRKVGIDLKTISELTDSNKIKMLGELGTNHFNEITYKGEIPEDISYMDRAAYYLFKYGTPNDIASIKNKNTKDNWRSRRNKVIKSISSVENELHEKFADKWLKLSTS